MTLITPPSSHSECQLLGGAFSYFVQFALGLLALSSLYIKWRLEKPRRDLEVVVYDVLKQAISACFCHGFNMLLAIALARDAASDECAWYFLNYIFDTLFAVFFSWGLLRLLEAAARRNGWDGLAESGSYGARGSYDACCGGRYAVDKAFVQQLCAWTAILLIVKAFLALPLYLLRRQLAELGDAMFRPMWRKPKTELAVVMVLAPCLCNIIQFWVYDYILMKGGSAKGSRCWGRRGDDRGEEALRWGQRRIRGNSIVEL